MPKKTHMRLGAEGLSANAAEALPGRRMKTTAVRVSEAPAQKGERSNVHTGLGADAIAQAVIDNLHCLRAKAPQHATRNDWYMALAYTVRDRMMDRYIRTVEAIATPDTATKAAA
jgi:hypothetical protein